MCVSQGKHDIDCAYGMDDGQLVLTSAVACEVGNLLKGRVDRATADIIEQSRQHGETLRILTDVRKFHNNM